MRYGLLLIGVAFLITWLLIQVFTLDPTKALLVTAVIFLILGVLVERPWEGR